MVSEKGSISTERHDRDRYLEGQLDHLYRFTGLVGSTLRVDMLLEDTLNPLLDIGRADKVLISLVSLGDTDDSIIKKRNWSDIEDIAVEPDEVALLGTDYISAWTEVPSIAKSGRCSEPLPE